MKEGKISPTQLVFLLFLSRIFSVLEQTPSFGDSFSGATLLLSTLLSFVMQCILVIPMLLLFYRYQEQNILGCAFLASPILGKIAACFFLLLFLLHLSGGYAIFSFFMTNIVYPKSSSFLIVLLLAAVCTACACYGLQGLARAGTVIFTLFILTTAFLSFAAADNADALNIHAIPGDGFSQIIESALNSTSKNTEFFAMLMLLPQIAKPQKKRACAFWFLTLTFLFIELTQFLILAVLGDFGMEQTFPYYALTTVIDFSIFQRLDSLHVTLWIFAAVFHCTLYSICISKCTAVLFPHKISRFTPLFSLAAGGGLGVFFAGNMQFLRQIKLSNSLFLTLVAAVFPLILFIILYRKEKRHAPQKGISAPAAHS